MKPLQTLTEEEFAAMQTEREACRNLNDEVRWGHRWVSNLQKELRAQRTESPPEGERGEMRHFAEVMLSSWEDVGASVAIMDMVGKEALGVLRKRINVLHWLLQQEERLHQIQCEQGAEE